MAPTAMKYTLGAIQGLPGRKSASNGDEILIGLAEQGIEVAVIIVIFYLVHSQLFD